MAYITPLIIEQHIHGAFGYDFNKVSTVDEIIFIADNLLKHGIGSFFPTLVTDSVDNIKRQIEIIKTAALSCPAILGIHLEGIFINPQKKGIHNEKHFLPLTKDSYKLIEDDFIRIITLAPELDEGLIDYLKTKDIKIQAGHCTGGDFSCVNGVTHTFNAMSGVSHKEKTAALSSLVNDNLYSEIIADGIHVNKEALDLFFRAKPKDKVILISDALPITYSDIKQSNFADSEIFYDGIKATSKDGTIAGSTSLLDKIIKYLGENDLMNEKYIENPYNYHKIESNGEIVWDENWTIKNIKVDK